jgi:hypothetical protein
MWYVGRKYGLRIDAFPGPWASLGVHIHAWPPSVAHLDLHLVWCLVTLGRHYGGPK